MHDSVQPMKSNKVIRVLGVLVGTLLCFVGISSVFHSEAEGWYEMAVSLSVTATGAIMIVYGISGRPSI